MIEFQVSTGMNGNNLNSSLTTNAPPAATTSSNFFWRMGIDGFTSLELNQEILKFYKNVLFSSEGRYENKAGTFFYFFSFTFSE